MTSPGHVMTSPGQVCLGTLMKKQASIYSVFVPNLNTTPLELQFMDPYDPGLDPDPGPGPVLGLCGLSGPLSSDHFRSSSTSCEANVTFCYIN